MRISRIQTAKLRPTQICLQAYSQEPFQLAATCKDDQVNTEEQQNATFHTQACVAICNILNKMARHVHLILWRRTSQTWFTGEEAPHTIVQLLIGGSNGDTTSILTRCVRKKILDISIRIRNTWSSCHPSITIIDRSTISSIQFPKRSYHFYYYEKQK